MKQIITSLLMTIFVATSTLAAATITYTYDKQHRLTQAAYSASQVSAYTYDAANNLDSEVSITDSKYMKTFLMYLSKVKRIWPLKRGLRLAKQSKI